MLKGYEEKKARTQICSAEGCGNKETERAFGMGFDGWAVVGWLFKNGKPALLCPECRAKVKKLITGGKINAFNLD